jgi:hypothetical protein
MSRYWLNLEKMKTVNAKKIELQKALLQVHPMMVISARSNPSARKTLSVSVHCHKRSGRTNHGLMYNVAHFWPYPKDNDNSCGQDNGNSCGQLR